MRLLQNFFILGDLPDSVEKGHFTLILVFISYAIAVFGSYSALTLASYMSVASAGRTRKILHWAGALALGSGIWAMHFIGMLAYKTDMVLSYNPALTALSMMIAIALAYGVLDIIRAPRLTMPRLTAGALLLGFSICVMHYTGMAAMEMRAQIRYIPWLFSLSVAISVGASAASLWIIHIFQRKQLQDMTLWKIAAALAMGGAICGMHYVGMEAAVISPYADCRYDANQNFNGLASAVAVIVSIIILMALAIDFYQKKKSSAENKHTFLPWLWSLSILLTLSALLTFLVYEKSREDYQVALKNYREDVSNDAHIAANQTKDALTSIYQDIRTISYLPSVRKINDQGKGLDADARETVQHIYNHMWENAAVSEVYVVQSTLDPDKLDPATGKLQEPMMMFDYNIKGHSSKAKAGLLPDADAPEEVEIFEYRQLRDTMAWLKAHYPDRASVESIKLPFVSGAPLITCDNSIYKQTRKDYDRTGIIFSVPFYGMNGQLKGTVSAIILNTVLRKLLLDKNYSLVNPDYHIAISDEGGQDDASTEWVAQGKPDPNLMYSEVIPLETTDPRSHWVLWAGFPDSRFLESGDYIAIRNFEYAGYGFAGSLSAFGLIILFMLRRNFRLVYAHNDNLTARLELESTQREALAAKEAAEAASVAKSEFLANMSHELRTPLNSILGMARMLSEAELPKEQHELADTVFRSSVNLLEIVNDILDLSKIEAGEMKLEHIGFDAGYVFHSVMHSLDHIAKEKRLPIIRHYDKDTFPYLVGDPTRLGRILTNLIGNAIKYTDKGQVDVYASCRPLDATHVELRCEIKDTGIGIPKDKHQRIFEKFVQADTSTTRKYGGTGLGLAITQQLVELMGGSIGLESEVGQGSTFWFTIAFETTDTLTEDKYIRRKKMLRGNIRAEDARILVAEDHPMNQLFMKKILKKFGITNIEIVENGVEVLAVHRASTWDIILMDCHMPEKNGYDTTKEIRELEKTTGKHIPIIAMTANAMVGDKEKCLRYGMDEYLSKPVNLDELKAVLSQWVLFDNDKK